MTSERKGQLSVTDEGGRPATARLATLARRLLSDDPLIRALAVQSALAAFGIGTFMTGSAVYFTRIVGLSVPQVGLGLTAGIAVQFLVSVPLGRVVHRFGALRCWVASSVLRGRGIPGLVRGPQLPGVHRGLGWRGGLLDPRQPRPWRVPAGGLPPEQRVRSSAYSRAALNVGFTLGALAGGIALATGTLTAVRLVPLVSLIIMTANALMVARLPQVAPQAAPVADAETGYAAVDGSAADARPAITGRPASRNVGFFLMSFFDGILGTHQVLLLTVIPLWLVADTNSPHVRWPGSSPPHHPGRALPGPRLPGRHQRPHRAARRVTRRRRSAASAR